MTKAMNNSTTPELLSDEARDLLSKVPPYPWHWVAGRTQQHLHGPDGNFAQVSMPIPKDREGESPRDDYRAAAELIARVPEFLSRLCNDLAAVTPERDRWETRAKELGREVEELESKNAALRDQLAQLTETAERRAGKYCDRPEDMPPTAIINIGFNVLESRLAQVEEERDTARAALAKLALEQTQP